nr:MAG TPA: hypothetical protein [Caudoviricetes sp.]
MRSRTLTHLCIHTLSNGIKNFLWLILDFRFKVSYSFFKIF